MNKEIIKRHKLTQKIFYTTIERSRRSNVYTYWHTVSVRLQKALNGWKHFKAEYFGIKNNKPAAKPWLKKNLRRGSV
jgi:hypothetical protein